MNLPDIPPAFLLILGALLTPFLKGNLRRIYVIALPAAALAVVASLTPDRSSWQFAALPWTAEPLTFLRVDKLSKAFGLIFCLNGFIAFIFAFYVKKSVQHVAALIYIGSALGAVFAGDFITLYVFWELMAVSATFVILSRNTERAKNAAFRYVMIHLLGGVVLLAGIAMTVSAQGGSIAFEGFDFAQDRNTGTWLILIGILVNAAAPPFSAWLTDAYPEASVTGGVILSAYTTKAAVFVLLRGYAGWEPLIWIGCLMAVYGIVFALMENDMRRILAYTSINQGGFMVCAAGIGTTEAIAGATAHAFCHVLYTSLLWMATGAVLYRVGKSRCTELGGLRGSMPWTAGFCVVGALAISAVPLTSGFTSKTVILYAAFNEHLFWPWLILEIASVGVIVHAGLRLPYFVFFGRDSGLRPKEAPKSMLLAMGILAFLCIFLGVYPRALYDILPYEVRFQAYAYRYLAMQAQFLAFSALAFFLFLPMLRQTATISLDTDWFYRKGAPLFARAADRICNGINEWTGRIVYGRIAPAVYGLFESLPSRLLGAAMWPWWVIRGLSAQEREDTRADLEMVTSRGAFPIGLTACLAVLLLALLFFF